MALVSFLFVGVCECSRPLLSGTAFQTGQVRALDCPSRDIQGYSAETTYNGYKQQLIKQSQEKYHATDIIRITARFGFAR